MYGCRSCFCNLCCWLAKVSDWCSLSQANLFDFAFCRFHGGTLPSRVLCAHPHLSPCLSKEPLLAAGSDMPVLAGFQGSLCFALSDLIELIAPLGSATVCSDTCHPCRQPHVPKAKKNGTPLNYFEINLKDIKF